MRAKSIESEISDIALFIHQAALDPHINIESLNTICEAAKHFEFSGLCTHSSLIPTARKTLGKNKRTKLISVIGFPFGSIPSKIKSLEAEWSIENGAEELEVVPNFLFLHEKQMDSFAEELAKICELGLPTRAILNGTKLSKKELKLAIDASIDAGVESIQTGNGFGPITNEGLINEMVAFSKGRCAIKAAGGIKEISHALELLNAGASIIGTSVGPLLLKQFRGSTP